METGAPKTNADKTSISLATENSKSVINYLNGPFTYKIVTDNNSLFVEAVHNEEYLIWSKIIDCELVPLAKNELIDIKLRPDVLFDLFNKKNNNCLDKQTEIVFPTTYKNASVPISIEIFMTFAFGKSYDVPFLILLDPQEISYEQRINKKLVSTKNMLEIMINSTKTECRGYTDERIDEEAYDDTDVRNTIDAKIAKLNTDTIAAYTTMITGAKTAVKTELVTEITKVKTELTAALSALKTELTNSLNAFKTEVANKYALK